MTVDPRVELVSTIFRLAGNAEYNQSRVPQYVKNVDKQFGPFRDHPAITLAIQLRRDHGVSFDACMKIAILDNLRLDKTVVHPSSGESAIAGLSQRDVQEFLIRIKQFAADTCFAEHIFRHQDMFDATISRLDAVLREAHLEWFRKFFGERRTTRFIVIAALLNGPNSYGPPHRAPDGSESLVCVLGVCKTDKYGTPMFGSDVIQTVVHEFCHGCANVIIDSRRKEFVTAGKTLFSRVASSMKAQAYETWKSMLCEALVRASVIRYVSRYGQTGSATRLIQHERQHGFVFMADLAELLTEYEEHRNIYPSLEAFSDQLVAFFDEQAHLAPCNEQIAEKESSSK